MDDMSQIPDDHWMESEDVLLDRDDVRVRYVPTDLAFGVGFTDKPGDEELLTPGEVRERIEEWDDEEVVSALSLGARMCSSAALAQVVGPDVIEAYSAGEITPEEFVDEFGSQVDRIIDVPNSEEL